MVSPFLFPNDIRGVRESAMMGMDLGPHTYQALSFTFLIQLNPAITDLKGPMNFMRYCRIALLPKGLSLTIFFAIFFDLNF